MDHVDVNFSYDLKYRFRAKHRKELWEKDVFNQDFFEEEIRIINKEFKKKPKSRSRSTSPKKSQKRLRNLDFITLKKSKDKDYKEDNLDIARLVIATAPPLFAVLSSIFFV